MSANRYILCILCLMVLGCYFTESRKTTPRNHSTNLCIRNETYNETHNVPYSFKDLVAYTTWCLSIPPRCTKYKYETKYASKNITVSKTRTIMECCEGYKKFGKTCVPECSPPCHHGQCLRPNGCLCDIGWEGPLCSEECPPDRFGLFCIESCPCAQGATCDSKTGACFCPPGYTGNYCEESCPVNTYGLHCMQNCMCHNDAVCDPTDGSCKCQPGYTGNFCEKPCEVGTHGLDCNFECICVQETTLSCHHVDGTCACKPGYQGKYCQSECGNLTFGLNCKEKCSCENDAFCNHITGKCLCAPGWTGPKCSEECPEGRFGEECNYKCLPCPNQFETCDKVTGNCTCPPNKVCSPKPVPRKCPEDFMCRNDGKCNSASGKCDCLPGWTDSDCSKACPSGTYGPNCSETCNCSDCVWKNGACLSKPNVHEGGDVADCPSGTYGKDCSEICNCVDCEWKNGTCISKSNNLGAGEAAGSSSAGGNSAIYILFPFALILLLCIGIYGFYRRRIHTFFQICWSKGLTRTNAITNESTDTIPDVSFANPIYVVPEVRNNDGFIESNVAPVEEFGQGIFRVSFKKHSTRNSQNAHSRPESKSSIRKSAKNASMEQSTAGDDTDPPEQLMDFQIESIYDTIKTSNSNDFENLKNSGNKAE